MKFVLAAMEVAAMSSPAPPSAVSCCAEGTKCAWPSRPTWLASSSRLGLRRSPTGRIRRPWLDAYRNFWTCLFRNFWKIRDLIRLWREVREPVTQCWEEISTTLTSLADGADLLFTGLTFEEAAANVAEYYDIPLATLHYFPVRANGQLVPILPSPLIRSAMTVSSGCLAHDEEARGRAAP